MIEKIIKQKDYELLDSGSGLKFERYGDFTMVRPDPEALWQKNFPQTQWEKRDLEFVRIGTRTKWLTRDGVPHSWNISFGDFIFKIHPSSFKHTGLFPEQLSNWKWMEEIITNYQLLITNKESGKRSDLKGAQGLTLRSSSIKVLNLFAYTGGATLACANAGAQVAHVDGSKTAVAWARENAELSGLKDAPIRWIVEDVVAFLKREIKRGNKYDAIIMDPPAFGHGPKDELWKIEEHFLELMNLCKGVLSDTPLFVLINGYTAGYSPIAYENNLKDIMSAHKGTIEIGELVIEESTPRKHLLPCGIFARWSKSEYES